MPYTRRAVSDFGIVTGSFTRNTAAKSTAPESISYSVTSSRRRTCVHGADRPMSPRRGNRYEMAAHVMRKPRGAASVMRLRTHRYMAHATSTSAAVAPIEPA